MTTFEKLDLLADSVNPVLIILAIIISIIKGIKQNKRIRVIKINIAYFIVSILAVYSIRSIDEKFELWSSFNLDYSTHQALALSSICYLIKISGRLWIWLIIIIMYDSLMLYQGYHSILDITTTSIILLLVMLFIYRML